jgi:hypothetical protein
MLGGRKPETCWAINKRQVNKLVNCCIWLMIVWIVRWSTHLKNLKNEAKYVRKTVTGAENIILCAKHAWLQKWSKDMCVFVCVYNASPNTVHSSLISLCVQWGRFKPGDCISKVKVTLPYKIHNQTDRAKQEKFPALRKHRTLLAAYFVIWMLTKTEVILIVVDHLWKYVINRIINLLKPTGYVMHQQV